MNKIMIALAASALLTTGALAHTPAPAPVEPAPTYNSTGFDWDGFYMGLGVTGLTFPSVGQNGGMIDVIAGVNMTSGDFLFGAEAWVGGYSLGPALSGVVGGAEARVGYLVSPEALVYLSGGGYAFDMGSTFGTLGGGVEFAVSDNVSVDLEYKYWGWSNVPGVAVGHTVGASLNWGF